MKLAAAAVLFLILGLVVYMGHAGDITPIRDRADPATAALEAFQKLHRGKAAQEAAIALLAEVETSVPAFARGDATENARVKSLRALCERLAHGAPAATTKLKEKSSRKLGMPEAAPREFPLPAHIRYRFGLRDIVTATDDDKTLASVLKAKKGLTVADLPGDEVVEALVHGCVPELELFVAACERDLDVHESADEYAMFLESWRNGGPFGDESFYESLDRSAGSEEAPFFYDAMLADFVMKFAAVEGKRWGLQERHDKNQQTFLAYRQYRGFIEAVAYSLALPSDIPLPKRLTRYDYASAGLNLLSLRHTIDSLVEFNGGDAAKVFDEVKEFIKARPLPEKLWTGYELAALFADDYRERAKSFPTTHNASAMELCDRQKASTLALAKEVRDATLKGLGAPQSTDRKR